ncbi:hypothetical protein [Amycolatopsis speibonae]|uniref:Uncharacterized protein n=1 Tax=Amycolatopsis speibonae TaxID=1450224 RepID=A0ABV7P6T0_9PSEU
MPRYDKEGANGRSAKRRILMVSIAVPAVLAALCGAAFIPKAANHFGYALPGEKGLPYRVHYNGRDYRSGQTCAGARWCEEEQSAEQRSRPYCMPRTGLDLEDNGAGLVMVDDVFTLFGPSRPVFTVGGLPQGETTTRVFVEASADCYLTYALMGGP